MRLVYRFLFAIAAYCYASAGYAEFVAWGGQWITQSSAHFVVNYQAEHQLQANHALAVAEQVHSELQPFFQQTPKGKTQLVIVDDYDLSNGWATPMPFKQIRLYLHAPNSVDGLEHMDSWWHGLIRHEYVHILQLEMGRGVVSAGRDIFGRFPLLFPHAFTPPVFVEGLAVYLESNPDLDYGRLQSSSYSMQMKAAVLAHDVDSLNQVVAAQREWPLGKQYLYGAYFWKYIAATYGEESIAEYLHIYSGRIVPYVFQNAVAKQVFGKSFHRLWQDYQAWLSVQFIQEEAVSDDELGSAQALQHLVDKQQATASSQQGLVHIRADGENRSQIQLWSSQAESAPLKLTTTKPALNLDVSSDGVLAVTRLVQHKTGQIYGDIFLWDEYRGWKRLTHKQRFTQVRWLTPQQLIASRQIAGQSELWQVDRQGQQQLLWAGQAEAVLGGFAIHPNGQTLVASMKRPQQGWNLEQFDFMTQQWQPITASKAIEHQPEYMDDGSLLFSADYEGTFNIYRLLPDQHTIEQLTQVQSGAFQPKVVDSQLYYQEYTSAGYQLQRLAAADQVVHQTFTIVSRQNKSYDYPQVGREIEIGVPRTYSALPTLLPKYWFPYINSDENAAFYGIETGGSDALGRHSYWLLAGYNPKYSLTELEFTYAYDNRWQLYHLQDHSYYNNILHNQPLVLTRSKTTAARGNIVTALEDQLQLALGISYERYGVGYIPDNVKLNKALPEEALLGGALIFNNQEYYRNVPGVGWGSRINLAYESFNVLNNDIAGYRIQGAWQHVFDLTGRSTLELTHWAGYSNQTQSLFYLGGSSHKDEYQVFGRHEFSFPGYATGALSGNKYYQSMLSYQHWLARVERNWGLLPLGLGDISGRLWGRAGKAWQPDRRQSTLSSVGAELDVELLLGYQLQVPVTLGVAQGLDRELGTTQAYLRLGIAF